MYPNYYYQQQPRQPQPQQAPLYLKGRPVSSYEEVKAIPIDFDGSIFYFPDLANNRIYTKQINLDGTAAINMYELKSFQQPAGNEYITREEFEETIKQLKADTAPKPVSVPTKKQDTPKF